MQTDNARRAEVFRELSPQECSARLRHAGVGRIGLTTPEGPVIIPVNYVMDDEAVVVRTAPYTLLAGHAWDQVAFEVDEVDLDMRRGWSVLVLGKGSPVEDDDELAHLRQVEALAPWAPGSRHMFIRITPRRITGREIAS